jgi:hypothetical protein
VTDNEVRQLMAKVEAMLIAQAEIRGDIKAIRDDNANGSKDHEDYEMRLRKLEVVDPKDIERRLRGLERVRWLVAGACAVIGSGVGAALSAFVR